MTAHSSNPLDFPVLILDKNYHPIKIAPAKIAVMLLFSEKAVVLDSSYTTYSAEDWISYSSMVQQNTLPVLRSSKINLVVPEVIVLLNYVRKPNHGKRLRYSRMSVFRRDNFCCQYCGHEFVRAELTVDHIIPKSKGGKSTWLNIVTACRPCNWAKADRTPEEAKMKLLNQPKIPTWRDSVDMPAGSHKEIWENFF
jgi:5-methylcytosine-specific restriction endonuclease McrA